MFETAKRWTMIGFVGAAAVVGLVDPFLLT
jgi:hypothetical protein